MTSREEFEAFIQRRDPGLNMSRNMPDRSYNNPRTHDEWEGWKAARATVPAWHDVPNAPGLWVSSSNEITFRLDAYDVDQLDKFNPSWRKWYGPIPKDAS